MSSEQRKILIIDDEPADRAIVKYHLEQSEPGRFVFFEAATGRAGVAEAAKIAPDCILLDYNLPDQDGVAVLQQLRDASGELRFAIVMLTGMGDQHTAVAAMKLGVMDYVAKGPASAESLGRTVRKAIEGYQLRRELAQQRVALEQRNAALEAMQRTLVAEKERYQLLTEAIPQLVWTSNRDGTIAFANQRMREFAGKSDGDRWDLTTLLEDDDKGRFAGAWSAAIDNNQSFEIELGCAAPRTMSTGGTWCAAFPWPPRASTRSPGSAPAPTSRIRSAARKRFVSSRNSTASACSPAASPTTLTISWWAF